jgi:hypothetical protein
MFIKKFRHLRMILASANEYQVSKEQSRVCVDMDKRECLYHEWIKTSIPCRCDPLRAL